MDSNEIQATCCKCGSGLKYPVTIGGKIYGTSCAVTHLGITDIPEHFTGNYDKWKAEKDANEEEELRKWAEHKKQVDKWIEMYKGDVKKISKAFYNARNDWEEEFMCSVARQIDLPILGHVKDWEDTTYRYGAMRREPRGLKSLSAKQMSIVERILNNYKN